MLDYAQGNNARYVYRLEGHDPYWVDARNVHEAYYANLALAPTPSACARRTEGMNRLKYR